MKGRYTPRELANKFNVPFHALRMRLNRYREQNDQGWFENPDRGGQDAKYLYQLEAVMPIIVEL